MAEPADVDEIVAVAAETFPLACPPSLTDDDIAAFIDANLSASRFGEYVADPQRAVLAAHTDERIIGYAMLIRGVIDDAAVQRAVPDRPAVELSKMYVLAGHHGAGAATALMNAALVTAAGLGARSVWLGVNQQNLRAQRFYAKHGFHTNGTKTFRVGASVENDYVMIRAM